MTSQREPSQRFRVDATGIDLDQDELARFARHLSLPEVGLAGQQSLKMASVLCVGSGGLGSSALLYLAAAGVGRLGVVDFDVVEVSNLQRQIIHSHRSLGKPKTNSAKDRILEINPNCKVDLYNVALKVENALEIIYDYDIVIDGTDNFQARYLVNDACVILGKPNVYGSVQRFEGQASVFNLGPHSPNYRDLVPEPPPANLVPSCAVAGVLGVLPGLIGVIQATEAIKIITGIGSTLSGRLLLIDALTMTFRQMTLKPSPERFVIDKLIDYDEFCYGKSQSDDDKSSAPFESVSVHQLKTLSESSEDDYVLIDVRTPDEARIAAIDGSILIPLDTIETGDSVDRIRSLAKGRKVYVYCKFGMRSAKALTILRTYGIEGINLSGGIDAWAKNIDLMMKRY